MEGASASLRLNGLHPPSYGRRFFDHPLQGLRSPSLSLARRKPSSSVTLSTFSEHSKSIQRSHGFFGKDHTLLPDDAATPTLEPNVRRPRQVMKAPRPLYTRRWSCGLASGHCGWSTSNHRSKKQSLIG